MSNDDALGEPRDRLADLVREVLAPLVAVDRGEIEWVGVVDGVAEIRLGGACAGCPGQSFTLNAVILPALRAVDPSLSGIRVRLGR